MGKFYNVAANAGVGKGRVAMGWVWEVSLNLLIEQTNFFPNSTSYKGNGHSLE